MTEANGVPQLGRGVGLSGALKSKSTTKVRFGGPTTVNMFVQPGSYSLTTQHEGHLVEAVYGEVSNPDPNRNVHFAGETIFTPVCNPSARISGQSTPNPNRNSSSWTTIDSQTGSTGQNSI